MELVKCASCANSGSPGFHLVEVGQSEDGVVHWTCWEICHDCGGTGWAHCCEGHRAQPEDAEHANA